jgi:serine/threonine-protein kinase
MIGQTIGHYRILEEIGRGGMGVVYRARDENLRRDVALKLLPPSTLANLTSRQRTRREALALSRLTHPAVAVIHDRISTPDCDCIVMEFVAGETLDKTLSRGPLPEPEALRLGIQLAQGLAAAHTAGVIHRDLKPGNLRITTDGRLKILDFGLAKQTAGSGDSTELDVTGSGAVVGTARYLAPELWLGKPASEASDLYAAGVILYEMGSGLHPFEDLALGGIARATVALDPPTPRQRNPALSAEFEQVILRCMNKDPARRISSAQELARTLEDLHTRHRRTVGDSPVPPKSAPASRRSVAIEGALLLVGAVIAVGVGLGWWSGLRRTPSIRSLAVLPLVNLSRDAREDYFADGMTDELISNLSESSSLLVISRTSAMSYKGTTKRLPLIAQELGVDAVVQGSVQLSGDRVRISVQLIDGREDRQLWSKHYNGDVRDALEIQNRVASSIAREIGLRLGDHSGTTRSGDTRVDPVAYQLYLQGRFQWNRRNPDGIRRAIGYFNSAIGRDSLYAPAYCGLADAWATAGISGFGQPTNAYPEAKRAALRALMLDPGLSEGYVSLGNIQQNFDWDWDAAARSYRRAIELNDNNAIAHHWYANHLALRGEFDRAMVEVRRAQDLDPLSLPINVGAGAFLYYARRYEDALVEYRRAMQIDSSSAMVNRALAASYIRLGRVDEAARAIQRWLESNYPGELPARAARSYRQNGFPGLLRVLLGAFKAKREAGLYEPATHVAELYCLLGEREEALRWLAVALRERDTQLNRLKVDPIFDPLRGDPRFEELARRVGLGPPA